MALDEVDWWNEDAWKPTKHVAVGEIRAFSPENYTQRPRSVCSRGSREKSSPRTATNSSCRSYSEMALGERRSCSRLSDSAVERTRRHSSHVTMESNALKGAQQRMLGLAQFRRSLRLLGLAPEDIGLIEDGTHRPHTPKPQVRPCSSCFPRGIKPKLNTRIQRRTVSAEDIRTAILLAEKQAEAAAIIVPVDDLVNREMIRQAVYEEWYFRKLEDLRKKREALLQQEKVKRWEEQHSKREQILKNQEKYTEWVSKKSGTQTSKPTDKGDTNNNNKKCSYGRPPGVRPSHDPKEVEAAYLKWKEEKDRILQQKRQQQELLKQKEIEAAKKKEEAEKAFISWKRRKDEELKKEALKKLEEEKKKQEMERKEKEEKLKEAESSFKAWKREKDKEILERTKKLRELKREEEESNEQDKRERAYEAQQAFLEWLDSVLDREMNEERQQYIRRHMEALKLEASNDGKRNPWR